MNELILHQYAASPFSEKVRCLLGYKQQAYRTVEIPVIMPKPDLMALTGGYRKTPVLQVGADIYCDTALICRLIDRLSPDKPVYSDAQMATLGAAAHWTDTFLFRVSVAVAFQPRALAASDLFSDQAAAEAFMADRAEFSKGSEALGLDLAIAEPHWFLHMRRLDKQLSSAAFLGGDAPNILDFSTYHCCWFVYKNDVLKSDLERYPALAKWMQAMAAFSQGDGIPLSGDDAVDIANTSEIATESKMTMVSGEKFAIGDSVEVMPIDYGFQPTKGALLVASMEELVVRRQDDRAGEVAVHFPRLGFQINKLD